MKPDMIEELRAETAAPEAPQEAAAVEGEVLMPEPNAEEVEGIAAALVPAIQGLGTLGIRKMGMEPDLSETEAWRVARPIAKLVLLYNLGPRDPKGQAMMGLGMAVLGIVGSRQRRVAAPDDAPQSAG